MCIDRKEGQSLHLIPPPLTYPQPHPGQQGSHLSDHDACVLFPSRFRGACQALSWVLNLPTMSGVALCYTCHFPLCRGSCHCLFEKQNKGHSPCWPVLCAVECVPGVYALSASPELHEGTHLSTTFGLHEGNLWPFGSLVKAQVSQAEFEPSDSSSGHLAGPTSALSNGLSGCRPCCCPRRVQQ